MGRKLLDGQRVYDEDDRIKSKDDQDVCQDLGESKKEKVVKEEINKGINSSNLVEVLSRTVDQYFPNLNQWFKDLTDIRDQESIDYNRETLMWTMLLTLITKQGARRQITEKMRPEENFFLNLKELCGQEDLEQVPHGDTVEYLSMRMEPEEMEELVVKIIKLLLRGRVLERFRLQGIYYKIAIDGVHMYSFDYPHCDKCTKKTSEKTGKTTWFHYKLQASLVTSSGMCLPVLSEWIENEESYDKQDCETKAFHRLIGKLRKYFPQLPMCILLDSLYANEPVFKAMDNADMQWIVVFKEGSMSEVYKYIMTNKEKFSKNKLVRRQEKEIPVRKKRTHQERLERTKPVRQTRVLKKEATYTWSSEKHWNNERTYNVITCTEVEDEVTNCDYVWLVSNGLNLDKSNVVEFAITGRGRWIIENQGFNMQKNGGYNLEHCYSEDEVSMKIWNFMLDIAHIVNQLIEQGSLIQKEVYGSIKNIAVKMFEHFCYYLFTKPPRHPRIQIRLRQPLRQIWWDSS